ncbi:ABC transporter ATP-binding protein [Albimonas sp. CAU 1670]|uniref:ABC transporter ATP-binding protein n=1 Tax=Albimonas sp. CAU 1670 TaxID=3032599 RepID=UPI0023DA88A7|nr:ABC transporter ATP-binding protein [Albimonas sp. CAU 1670]MDF2235216.1 ABC transporter ATP-binding protein [Albimonas sp. CAU 1670]
MFELDDLRIHFPLASGEVVKAVDGVTLSLAPGETVGLVGESGSGKSTIGKAALGLIPATSGAIRVGGEDVVGASPATLRRLRSRAQIIFQDPHASLNPRMTISRSVAEGLILNTPLRGRALRERVAELLARVGLPEQFLNRFPHELSGGQKQRACIARALALDPEVLVLDEPTSALDVSVQAQILTFLKELQAARPSMTSLFISHNLAVVRFLCQRVAVMYLGRIVEEGPVDEVFENPRHPYTRALLAAAPAPEANPRAKGPRVDYVELTGDIPSPVNTPSGCAFHTRCPVARKGICDVDRPADLEVGPRHRAACHFAKDLEAA